MRLDAHQHFWNLAQFPHPWITPELPALRRDFGPADLKPHLERHSLDGSILVQTFSSLEESRFFLSLATQHPWIRGVVAWVDLTDPDVGETVEALQEHPKFVGIRHVVHDEPDPLWLNRHEVMAGLATLELHRVPYDLLLRPQHLPAAIEVARHYPGLPLVVDHIAKPRIAQEGWGEWAEGIRSLARFPNVWCKLSGMITEAARGGWKPEDLKPYVRHVLEVFGPERLMYGSDWPVCLLAGSYDQVVEALEANLKDLSTQDRERIWGESAAAFYGIRPH
ncbi:MAG TPA: amidohydrolase [Verrucomicrobiales bacterium]|nr:amidohydrolase [Verrucomicrobiales bacterium]